MLKCRMSSFKLNILSSTALRLISVVSGLILPRLILGRFGSEVNGLISSISQFLSYTTLLEAGVGSVARAEMFRPLAEKDNYALSQVVNSCREFFKRLGSIFWCYTLVLSVAYSCFAQNESILVHLRPDSYYGHRCVYAELLQHDRLSAAAG